MKGILPNVICVIFIASCNHEPKQNSPGEKIANTKAVYFEKNISKKRQEVISLIITDDESGDMYIDDRE